MKIDKCNEWRQYSTSDEEKIKEKINNYCNLWMKKEEVKEDEEVENEDEECDQEDEECDQEDWMITDKENKPNLPDPITCFIEAYDICGPTATVVKEILKKKNSERTEVDKEIIRRIVCASKSERPKIRIERMEENRDRVELKK